MNYIELNLIHKQKMDTFPNCKFDDTLRDRSEPQKCLNCKHGFYSKAEVEKDRELLINIIKDYGY